MQSSTSIRRRTPRTTCTVRAGPHGPEPPAWWAAWWPVFVKDIFQRGPETYGNLLALMGIGSICGSLTIAGAGNIKRKGRVALCALATLGAGIAGFALSKSLPLSYTFLVLVGASMMAVFATVNSLVQLITTNEMRGRVMSVYNFAFRGGMPMGNLLSGW